MATNDGTPGGFRPIRLDPDAPPPPPPTMVYMTKPDGTKEHALFCEGDTYLITGIQESGKSWIAAVAAIEWIKAGKTVWWFDPDGMGQARLVERLRILGITDKQMAEQFIYSPADLSQTRLSDYGEQMAEWANEYEPDLFIVDSWGPSLGVVGLDQHQADDIQSWWRAFVVPIRNEREQMTTILLDHQPKDDSSNQVKGVYGSQRKLSVVDWGLSMKATDKLGYFAMKKLKARGMQWMAWQEHTLKLEIHETGWEITMPEPSEDVQEMVRSIAQKISWVAHEAGEPITRRKLMALYRDDGGQAADEHFKNALAFLADGGFVNDKGTLINNRWPAYEWVKRYPPYDERGAPNDPETGDEFPF